MGWTTYLQGNGRTGFNGGENAFTPASAPNLHLAWKASDSGKPESGVFSQPIVSNGKVYWGSFDGYERATDTSGHLVWKTFLGHTIDPTLHRSALSGCRRAPRRSVRTLRSGTATSVLYVGGGDTKVYALNAATGAVLWSHSVGSNPDHFMWSSPAVFGNSVYIGVSSFGDCPLVQGQLVQLDRTTGAVQHTFNVVPNGCIGGGVWGSPTIDEAAGTIYFTTGNDGDCAQQRTARPGHRRSARVRPEPRGLVDGAPRAAGRRQRLRVDPDVVQRCHRRTVARARRCDQQERRLLRVPAGRARVGTGLEHPDRERRRQPDHRNR